VRFPDLEEEQEDGQKMREIAGKSDDIHGEAFLTNNNNNNSQGVR